ncbi:hypothetical protein ACVIQY_003205 [Bradyrhizobium sp. USDA 3051]
MLLSIAGTRPEPAVSVPSDSGTSPAPTAVPSDSGTSPAPTAVADPELEPPGMRSSRIAFLGMPWGERTPTRPVANWSRLVLPMMIAPAARSRCTAVESCVGVYEKAGHAAVVGNPSASILSFTTTGTP